MDGASKPHGDEHEALARAAAVKVGLPEDLWDRLRGDTFEELLADAIDLALPVEIREAKGPLKLTGTDADGTMWSGAVARIDLARAFVDRRRQEPPLALPPARGRSTPRPRASRARPRRTRAGAGAAASRDGPSDEPPLDSRGLRLRPELLIRLPLEGGAEIRILAESFEDERRLLRWLAEAEAVLALPADILDAVLDRLEGAE